MWPFTSRQRAESGSTVIETALVFPLLVLLIFGMIEFAFVMRDYAGVANSVRVGSRVAATGANAGAAACETGLEAPPCAPASSPVLAQEAADAIQRGGSSMPGDNINYLLVYKANSAGFPGADGNTTMPTTCQGVTNCVEFRWRDSLDAFRYHVGSWSSVSISACFPGSPTNPMHRVGIYLDASHPMMTGLFGASIHLTDRAVMNFEPLPTQSCGANQHL